MLLHCELQYEIAITAPTTFLQISNVTAERFFSNTVELFLQIADTFFAKNHQISLLQIAEHVFSKSPTYFATRFLQITKYFAPNLQDISSISEQHTLCSILYGKDPVSDLSLHVLRAPRSTLWVVGYGSLVTPIHPTRLRAPRLTLWTMG